MINRRSVLGALIAATVGSQCRVARALTGSGDAAAAPALMWRNWSGSQQCAPALRTAPASVAQLQELIATTRGTLRPVGAGHSFSPLVPTDGTLVSLARLSGVVDYEPKNLRATLWSGTRLGEIGQPLEAAGQALVNMPDIDEQTIAGCLATATHGTGAGIGCMSSFIEQIQLVDSRGELLHCSASNNVDLFQAAKVSLGAVGVITQVKLQNSAPYQLRRELTWRDFDEMLELAEDMSRQHRNFEFYYIPFSGMGFTDVHDLTSEPAGSTEKIDANDAVEDLMLARDWLQRSPRLRELILGGYMRTLNNEVTVERAWKNYASERNVRFNEMEYHLPKEYGLQALREIRATLEAQHHEVFFPIEVRFVKADDIWLSPFYQRDTCSIAVHRYFDEDYVPFFKAIEPIFRKYQGRPHWGKLNTLQRKDFENLYPHWDDFFQVRKEIDPQGRFLNPYLAGLFG